MSTFDYVVESGNKQHMIKKNHAFLVDKLHDCQDGQSVDIVCLVKGNTLCKNGETVKAEVKKSLVLDRNKRRLSKRKARSHHSRGIKGFRPKHTMLVVKESN